MSFLATSQSILAHNSISALGFWLYSNCTQWGGDWDIIKGALHPEQFPQKCVCSPLHLDDKAGIRAIPAGKCCCVLTHAAIQGSCTDLSWLLLWGFSHKLLKGLDWFWLCCHSATWAALLQTPGEVWGSWVFRQGTGARICYSTLSDKRPSTFLAFPHKSIFVWLPVLYHFPFCFFFFFWLLVLNFAQGYIQQRLLPQNTALNHYHINIWKSHLNPPWKWMLCKKSKPQLSRKQRIFAPHEAFCKGHLAAVVMTF